MAEKPIIFNTPMVQAILAGRKTQTRRVINPRYKAAEYGFHVCTIEATGDRWVEKYDENEMGFDNPRYIPPRYIPNDILWVRETWLRYETIDSWLDNVNLYMFKADYTADQLDHIKRQKGKWRPSIHMPHEAARIFLRVTNVRVERVREILCGDMKAEGCIPEKVTGGQWQQWQRDYFAPLWNSINAKRGYGWDANPWVWVYEFERVER
jgi:hypothetical protein